MRIASLLPAATDWVCEFGGAADLVACTHECVVPGREVPVVTGPHVDTSTNSAGIDSQVRSRLKDGLSIYSVDYASLRSRKPDLVLTQDQCEACAVPLDEVRNALLGAPEEGGPEVYSLNPVTLKQILEAALAIGRLTGRLRQAMRVIGNGELRLKYISNLIRAVRGDSSEAAPSLACIEWFDPLMVAGHWIPDIIESAGGRSVAGSSGQPSQYVSWQDLLKWDPDILILAPCGFAVGKAADRIHELTGQPVWTDLRAVDSGQVFLLDGNRFLNRPGPTIYRSVELLATVLHGDRMEGLLATPSVAEVLSLDDLKWAGGA